jgi:hypothetical protein
MVLHPFKVSEYSIDGGQYLVPKIIQASLLRDQDPRGEWLNDLQNLVDYMRHPFGCVNGYSICQDRRVKTHFSAIYAVP